MPERILAIRVPKSRDKVESLALLRGGQGDSRI